MYDQLLSNKINMEMTEILTVYICFHLNYIYMYVCKFIIT